MVSHGAAVAGAFQQSLWTNKSSPFLPKTSTGGFSNQLRIEFLKSFLLIKCLTKFLNKKSIMSRKMLIDGAVEEIFDFDLIVIGAGSGGVGASRTSAGLGAKVAICELPFHPISSETIGGIGGTCVIRGCVPKKILVYGASFAGEFQDARNFGWELSENIDYN